MKKYVKEFMHRGLMFGGFGPVVVGIIYVIITNFETEFVLSAKEVLLAIISTYILAFLQAGATVYNQIEHWSLPKSLFCHFVTLYLAYSLCYIANSWIPFEPKVLLIFSLIFIASFFAIWFIVYFCVRATSEEFNKKIERDKL